MQRETVGARPAVRGPDRVAHTSLPGNPRSPGTARGFVRRVLAGWAEAGLPESGPFAERLADDAALLVSELVTNAVVHAGTEVELVCRLVPADGPGGFADGAGGSRDGAGSVDGGADGADGGAEALVVEVSDHHPARPLRGEPHPAGEYGRGLHLVGALAESWGVSYRRGLKTVWFRLSATAGAVVPDVAVRGVPPLWAAVPVPGAVLASGAPPAPGAPLPSGGPAGDPVPRPGPDPAPDRDGGWCSRGALSFLAEASDLLAGQFDEEKVAALAAQLLVPRFADWCAVWLDGEDGRGPGAQPRLARVWHANETRIEGLRTVLEKDPPALPDAALGWPVPWPWPQAAVVVAVPVPEGTADGPVLAEWPDPEPGDEHGSALACRLFAGGRSVGTLLLGRAGLARIPDEVTALVEDFARRVALAVVSARQYTRQATTSLVLQQGLRPRSIAAVPGVDTQVVYEPAGEGAWAGGDFYDIFHAGEGRWCFALGDVCGSGPEAAVVTGLVRPWLKLLAHEGHGVAGVLDRLNRMLVDDATQATEAAAAAVAAVAAVATAGAHPAGEVTQVRFLSLLFGELVATGEAGGLRCTLASAGHPLPLLLRPDGRVRPVAAPQVLLGVLEDTAYETGTFDLEPGDTLLCVTDGVTERRSGRRQFDDDDGLAAALAGCAGLGAAGTAERIRALVHGFDTAPPDDDLALLVLHRR
ncbi:ATP-binding SpoIIE family protein phosphatase [Streptomyces sp. NPDC002055]|uniref:ATP-binding SpoIIE family protein phosphatase n=1 Tax=Streptomyces sp. NPDC002055 TaxID=3154534 RepID=UPI003317A601